MIQHEIVDLIHVEKIEVAGARRGNSHLVVEQPMAAHRLHPRVMLRTHQVLAPLLAQTHNSAIRAGGLLPVVRQGPYLPTKINPYVGATRCLSCPILGVDAVGHCSSHRHSCSRKELPAIDHSSLLAVSLIVSSGISFHLR